MLDIEDMDMVRESAVFAAIAHKDQTRKDGCTPYIVHPARVASLVMLFGSRDLESTDLKLALCSAWLHDVIEDTPYEIDDVLDKLSIGDWATERGLLKESILALTKNESLYPREVKLRDSLERISKAPPFTALVKICDRIDNCLDLCGFDNVYITRYINNTDILIKMVEEFDEDRKFVNALDTLKETVNYITDGWD